MHVFYFFFRVLSGWFKCVQGPIYNILQPSCSAGLSSWDLDGRLLSLWPWLAHFSPPLVLPRCGCDFFTCRLIRKCCTIPSASFPGKCKSNELDNTSKFPRLCFSGISMHWFGCPCQLCTCQPNFRIYSAFVCIVSIRHLPVHLFIEYLLFWDGTSPMPVSIHFYHQFAALLLGSLSSQASWMSSVTASLVVRIMEVVVEFVRAKAAFEPHRADCLIVTIPRSKFGI